MKKIIVILDASGSMGEDEKKSSLKYTMYAIKGLMESDFSNIEYEFYKWSETINKFDDINKVDFGKCLNEDKILKFLMEKVDEKILFITDGNFERLLRDKMKKFVDTKKIGFNVIAMGCDCDIVTLKKVFGRDNVYYPYDIAACISNLLFS